ncbi:MAG: RNA methyltransferase [Bacteroidales bacterium]
MISRNQVSLIRSLERKKFREAEKCFVAEGVKVIGELLDLPPGTRFRIRTLFCTASWLTAQRGAYSNQPGEIMVITDQELLKISHLTTPNQVLALVELPDSGSWAVDFDHDLVLGLEQVQDPGNCGTLIRLAEWFGLSGLFFSTDCADLYSPKVVQASMGSIFRVRSSVCDLPELVRSWPQEFPVYGTRLDGENLYSTGLTPHGMVLMGNESRGMSGELGSLVDINLRIPGFSVDGKVDSLNVAIAAALVCGEFRRRASV